MDLPPDFDQKQPLINGVLKSYFNQIMTEVNTSPEIESSAVASLLTHKLTEE